MKGFESQSGKTEDLPLENYQEYFDKMSGFGNENNSESSKEDDLFLFLSPENREKVFKLYTLQIRFIEQLPEKEIVPFMQKNADFEEKIKAMAENGELMFGDNLIGVKDLNKFALYCVLIGTNFEKAMWLDFDGAPIEKFMLETYETDDFAEALAA
jgi:hypothetical protein